MSAKDSKIIYESVFADPIVFMIGLCAYRKDIYGVSVNESVLVRFDTEKREVKYEKIIPDCEINTYQSYLCLKVIDDVMYFIPFQADNLILYDAKTGGFQTFGLSLQKELEGDSVRKQRFGNLCKYRNKLFLFPFCYRAMIVYDLETKETREVVSLNHTELKNDMFFFHSYEYISEKTILLTSYSSNRIMIFDLETEEYKIKRIGSEDYCFSAVKKAGDDFWIFVKNTSSVLKWNMEKDAVEEFLLPGDCIAVNDKYIFDPVGEIALYKGCLYAFPAAGNMAVRLDVRTGETKEIEALRQYCQNRQLNKETSSFFGAVQIENKVYLHYQLDKILEFNMDMDEVKEYPRALSLSDDDCERMNKDIWEYFLKRI